MRIWKWTLALLLMMACAWNAFAGDSRDIAGSKDHPLLTRYPGSFITEYKHNYDASEFTVGTDGGAPKHQRIEGDRTFLRYFYDSPEHQPSALELIRNYQNAIKAIGGEVVYERLPTDDDLGETTLKVDTGGKEFWIKVAPEFGAPTQNYTLDIVEIAAMSQVVSANKMLDELNKNGYIALYINFDTNKWDLKDDGRATVKEIVAMMKASPSLKLSVEGHTDNVGSAPANKTLSENRARSVMNAIVAGGIDASRLSAVGYGQERPIADNRSEEGRAKNRRVELVKK